MQARQFWTDKIFSREYAVDISDAMWQNVPPMNSGRN